MKTNYLFYPEEFPEPDVEVCHIDLTLDIEEKNVEAAAKTTFKAASNLTSLSLNAKNLEILSITQNGNDLPYAYEHDLITIQINPVFAGEEFTILTKTICHPTDNILEGLYYDITPAGKPRTIISQCQQWGFQRIVPCIDDMRAKCTWTTTIRADSRYTNLISNGNVSIPRSRYDDTRDSITYQNDEPMPPYLFFLGVGTWDTFSRDFIYPNGKTVRLELLTLPGANKKDAETAVEIMADAVLWTHIFTGAERFKDTEKRQKLYELCTRRFQTADDSYTAEIERLAAGMTFGYQYPYEVYREIAMQNSDFGGMENTGNTTIIASRIMPDAEITDAAYEYLFGVKQHEFYHNLNGSGVTGDTPFSIWLNEAVTVMMEDEYLAFHFGKEYTRLNNILQMYAPGVGTFSLDTGAISMPIEPDGFNDPNDLITSVTYVKAPEFTRMIEVMLGKEAFAHALNVYHTEFFGGNASPKDWLSAMGKEGKTDFSEMAQRWLKQTGFPTVTASAEYKPETNTAEISVMQKGFGSQKPWIFPFTGKLLDETGKTVAQFSHVIDAEKTTFSVPCPGAFACAVWNENHAAYIKMERCESDEILYLQTKLDTNPTTRFLAFETLFEREMMRLLEDETAKPTPAFRDEVMRTLRDETLMKSCGSLPLLMFEAVTDPRFEHAYTKLYAAKQKILRGIAETYEEELLALYRFYGEEIPQSGGNPAELSQKFKAHAVQNCILTILSTLDTEEIQNLAYAQYAKSGNATARLSALTLYLSSSAANRMDVVQAELKRSAANPLAFENFIAAVANASSPDTVSYLKLIEASPMFHIEQAGVSRSLYLRFAQNRKLSLETETGRAFLQESIIRLAAVNAYITTGMLSVFSHMHAYAADLQKILMQMLHDIERSISAEESPAVYQTVKQLIGAM